MTRTDVAKRAGSEPAELEISGVELLSGERADGVLTVEAGGVAVVRVDAASVS